MKSDNLVNSVPRGDYILVITQSFFKFLILITCIIQNTYIAEDVGRFIGETNEDSCVLKPKYQNPVNTRAPIFVVRTLSVDGASANKIYI